RTELAKSMPRPSTLCLRVAGQKAIRATEALHAFTGSTQFVSAVEWRKRERLRPPGCISQFFAAGDVQGSVENWIRPRIIIRQLAQRQVVARIESCEGLCLPLRIRSAEITSHQPVPVKVMEGKVIH